MIAVEDVNAFVVVPWETLGTRQAHLCSIGVRKGDRAVVNPNAVPGSVRIFNATAIKRRIRQPWDGEILAQVCYDRSSHQILELGRLEARGEARAHRRWFVLRY